MNSYGVCWTFSERCNKAVFLDMNIWIKKGKLLTSLYTKPLNRHLFIPPHSCHSPGVFKGLIFGHIQRICMLCSLKRDIQIELDLFFERLLNRGYSPTFLEPCFSKAIHNAATYRDKFFKSTTLVNRILGTNDVKTIKDVFFHTPFHPSHPNSKIKQAWKKLPPAQLAN